MLEKDEDQCAATVVKDIEEMLKDMDPQVWENWAIDGMALKEETDDLLNDNDDDISLEEYRKELDILEEKWKNYRAQQDFNKWTALRHWLKIPGLRQRLQVIAKDLRSDPTSRNRRTLVRVKKVELLLYSIKEMLRDIYAIYHREGKLMYSEDKLKDLISQAIARRKSKQRRFVSKEPRKYYNMFKARQCKWWDPYC